MKKLIFILCILPILVFTSCKNSSMLLPNPSGGAYEVLLIIDNDDYKSAAGKEIFDILNAPVPHLPQPEPQFRISRLPNNQFDNLLKTTRNIVFVTIDSSLYTQAKIGYTSEKWAKTQAIVSITGPNSESVDTLLKKNEQNIQNFFIKAELFRQKEFLKANSNKSANDKIYKMFQSTMNVPSSINKYKEGENFFWASNGSATVRQDIVVYSYPYTSKEQLTPERLLATRDSVMKANIHGSFKESYMGTEYVYDTPSVKDINVNNAYATEIRGLWKMINGEAMGGPFVSHTRIDEVNQRVVTIEGFVFAPGKDKRNALRQVEAMVYSFRLPQEVNEVIITATPPKSKTK